MSGETKWGYAISAFCKDHLWRTPMHTSCRALFIHHTTGEGPTRTVFRARCRCACHFLNQGSHSPRAEAPRVETATRGERESTHDQ
jgi:hypothetical protein